MTQTATTEPAPSLPLSGARLEAFGKELDAIRERVLSELGEADAQYIRRVFKVQRLAEVGGRGLLVLGLFPPAWMGGVTLLSLSKILENMEIGHNVLHGQYDWMNDPAIRGSTYEWDWACPADAWRHSHNVIHHTYTNIVGKDRDVGYSLLRMADDQHWWLISLPQPIYAFFQMVLFEWAVAVHDLEGERIIRGEKPLPELLEQLQALVKKGSKQLFKDFVLFPVLSGPAAPWVFTGNLSANLIRNIWAFLVIYCGHFPDHVYMFRDDEALDTSAAGWYQRQILGSANVEGPWWFHVLSGNLSHQIEHHLFPDLPAYRYGAMASEVRALCQKYGVPYNTGSFGQQLGGAVRRIFGKALPPALSGPSGLFARGKAVLRGSAFSREHDQKHRAGGQPFMQEATV